MKREYWKECSGCCWMKRAGELYWMCLVRECPFHPYHLKNVPPRSRENLLQAQDCFG